jgi:hypothetical protein
MAIAALARAGGAGIAGDYGAERYLETARSGFDHVQERGVAYLDDGTDNIIDDYCGLLAATELYAATGEASYAEAAAGRHASLAGRFGATASGGEKADHWYADRPGGRPYYHAAEAGLPVMALLRYAEVMRGTEEAAAACDLAARALRAELAVTGDVANPFGYARQWTARPDGPEGKSFFIPHENETGYWWQGENARLASLAAAALWGAAGPAGAASAAELRAYAVDQLNWILGLNPFDVSMMDGVGRHNPEYMSEFPNAPGGICNGITAGFEEEGDIAFLPEPAASSPYHRWRWSEQWIPHAGWFLLAAAWTAAWTHDG